MTVAELKENLCEDLIVDAFERQDRKFLVTRFTYPVGDSVNLYLVEDQRGQRISDLGTTHYFLKVANVDMDTEARFDFVKSVCAGFDVEVGTDFVLSKSISAKTAAEDVLAFCQAITRISALHYDERTKQFQTFADEIDGFVTQRVPSEHVFKNWTDESIDPERDYLVDYHFNGRADSRNMFVVRSRLNAETVNGTMNFYLANNRDYASMVVIAPDLHLPRKVEKKLEKNSRVVYGLDEKVIDEFAQRK